MAKILWIIGLIIALFIIVPIIQLVLYEFTKTGGIFQSAFTPFELAIWQFWPLGVAIFVIVLLVRAFSNKQQPPQ